MLVPLLTLIFGITIGVLVIVWLEREISTVIQQRIGPEYAGPLGILQALADGTKLLFKESILPSRGNTHLFCIGPAIADISILLSFSVIPFSSRLILADLNICIFLWIAISRYGSNNKYSFLGGLRAAAQSISYEIPLTLYVLSLSLQVSGRKRKWKKSLPQDGLISQSSLKRAQKINRIEFSLSFGIEQKTSGWLGTPKYIKDCTVDIVEAQSKYGFIVFLISSLAECERLPFDLPEAVEELFFIGGWNISIPLRMDQLLNLGWKFLLPISLGNLLLTTSSQLLSL
ncbi:hypothetical protein ERO13_D04G093016v2 [Gossypium hirsutum]|nr:hypothetical protein ERO13_D04G093016v2 [Gossypium hirsutum]